jgi:hypothetical protein
MIKTPDDSRMASLIIVELILSAGLAALWGASPTSGRSNRHHRGD